MDGTHSVDFKDPTFASIGEGFGYEAAVVSPTGQKARTVQHLHLQSKFRKAGLAGRAGQ